jgi:phage N-6-adenine-methyltransferase
MNVGMFSSATEDWATPDDFFAELNREFHFTLDACASEWNKKVDNYYDKEQDGLKQQWTGTVWMNPPYGREIKKWMAKAVESAQSGATVVCLVPARTDTAWWHNYAMLGEIRFLRGRIKFVGPDGPKDAAPFPSALIIFRPTRFQIGDN